MISLLCRIAIVASLCLMSCAVHAVTPMMAVGRGTSTFLNSDGSVWRTGYSGSTSPIRLFDLPGVVAIASGEFADFALLADGTLWGMGSNENGRLGDGTTLHRSLPQRVAGLSGVKAVAFSFRYGLALKEDGTVWAWGSNDSGQLGDGTRTDRYVPTQVVGLTNITKVAVSWSSSLALRSDGTVWMWGVAPGGAAGDGTVPGNFDPSLYHLVPTKVQIDNVIDIAGGGGSPSLALRADGTVWAWGGGPNGFADGRRPLIPEQIPGLDQIVAIAAKGEMNALALRADGTVWGWGYNNKGQVGSSDLLSVITPTRILGLSDIVAIETGWEHSLARRRDGVIVAWGSNGNGELGDGTVLSRAEPRPVLGPGGSIELNLLQPAPTSYNQLPTAQLRLDTISGRAPLTVNANALDSTDLDGTIADYIWSTSDGQQASGASATFAFSQPGTYGIKLLVEDNSGGRGYAGQSVVVTSPPVAVTAKPKIGISYGYGHATALTGDGRILKWGITSRLGLYAQQIQGPVTITGSVPFANGISGAVDFSNSEGGHVLLADGTILGWGWNMVGTPGVGSPESFMIYEPQPLPNLPPSQAVASGGSHGLALAIDGRVFAWGENSSGQLGLGDNQNRFTPVEVTGISKVVAIEAGDAFSIALREDGTVWGWGGIPGVQIGDGTPSSTYRPVQIPGLSGITRIFSSQANVLAQSADGKVWVAGGLSLTIVGDHGGLRNLAIFDGAVQIAAGRRHIIVLKPDGTVWTGGQQASYALGFSGGGDIKGIRQVPGISDAIGVAAAEYDSAVLLRDGTVLMWGRNDWGQIGDGTFALRPTPVAVVNETADGFLDLIPGADFELPPGVGVPFFVVASGSVADVTASVNTKAKFNAADVGKTGEVFVTARAAAGSMRAIKAATASAGSTSGTYGASSALTAADAFELMQLTPSGWQSVVNGQLLPYASGVLGEQLSAQTILNAIDTTNLKGAQFCVGYGSSADEMIAAGRMRVVATIPDPNATSTPTVTCLLAGPPVNYSLNLPQGWSLLGNSLNQALTVSTLFNDTNAITSVWKWDANIFGWQFYTPLMSAPELQTYAASKGYAVLNTINPGEGYWVNAKAQPTIGTQSGDSFILTGMSLAKGWNLVATGNDITPSEFNTNLKASAVPANLTALWAWDNPQGAWYFYAPSLEAQGGTALSGYIANKGYLDFATARKTLGNGTGFWVNR